MQEVLFDSKLRLLDSPGLVLPGGDMNDGVAALRNAVKIETLDDPLKPVEAIYNRCSKSQVGIISIIDQQLSERKKKIKSF